MIKIKLYIILFKNNYDYFYGIKNSHRTTLSAPCILKENRKVINANIYLLDLLELIKIPLFMVKVQDANNDVTKRYVGGE